MEETLNKSGHTKFQNSTPFLGDIEKALLKHTIRHMFNHSMRRLAGNT